MLLITDTAAHVLKFHQNWTKNVNGHGIWMEFWPVFIRSSLWRSDNLKMKLP